MPPSGFSQEAINGLLVFVQECYKDLLKEMKEGKDKHGRLVTEGQAIQKELEQIGSYLKEFKI
ncbi:MAG: hypothetical protein KJ879_02765 [Nanoarchaeota archaeon]|nr:hypothetical protein [Nanoarchaeota archaeon]